MAWIALLGAVVGFLWLRQQPTTAPALEVWGDALLESPPGEAQRVHRLAFLLDKPSALRLLVRNPSGAEGSLRIGPPSNAKPVDGLHAMDPEWTETYVLDGSKQQRFDQLVLAVGTRLVTFELQAEAAIGLRVEGRAWTTPAPQRVTNPGTR